MSVDEIRSGLEEELGVKLGDSEQAVKQAYGGVIGLRGDLLDLEWDILLGVDPGAVPADLDVPEVPGVKGSRPSSGRGGE